MVSLMIALGVLACLAAAILVVTLLAFSRRFNLAATYHRVAWLPVAALLHRGGTVETAAHEPELFCRHSTAAHGHRERREGTTKLLRATLIAAIPGMLLLTYMFYGLVNAMLRSRDA
jgi:hypothetical protein